MPTDFAYVPPHKPSLGKGGGTFYPGHAMDTRHPQEQQGDPFNPRNVVQYQDFYAVGKPWDHPGHHVNLYTNVHGIHAVMENTFGFIATKLRYIRQPNRIIRGRQRALGQDVNVDMPQPATYGDFATYASGTRIRTATRG